MASLPTLGLQVSALFGLIYAWFYNGVPGVWKQVSTADEADQLLSRLSLRAPASATGGQFENLREFASIAAVSHTFVLLLGFALSAVAANVAAGVGGANPQRSLAARFLKRSATRWTAFGACVALGFVGLHAFFRWSFENRVGITYRLAAQFFYERDGSSPFALMSATSYVAFFAAGFAVKQLSPSSNDGRGGDGEGIFPPMLIRWTPWLVKAFLVAMVAFHFAVMPLYDRVVKPAIKCSGGGVGGGVGGEDLDVASPATDDDDDEDFTHHFAVLASVSHTTALALGLLLCRLARLSACQLNAVRPSRRQALGVAAPVAAVAACLVLAAGVRRYTSVSLASVVLFMAAAVHDWCCSRLAAALHAQAAIANRLAAALGMGEVGQAAHPLVLLSLAAWFAVGLAMEYWSAANAAPAAVKAGRAEEPVVRPVFSLGPVRVYPVSRATADAVGWLLPLGFTLVGLAHEHVALFYDSLARSFLTLLATVLPGAMLTQAFCQRFGRKIQAEKTAPPMFWEESRDTIGTLYLAACFLAWPVTKYRSGQTIALRWSLDETGDSLWFYLLVKLIGGIVLADCWNYWKHRALHWRMLYAFHKDHHGYHDPSCFASFAIHPFEALLTFWQLMLFSIPGLNLWGPVHIGALVVLAAMNLYLHCGYALTWLERSLPWVLLNTSQFHNVHHEVTRAHFGEILFLWDWLCGTAIDRRLDDHPVIAGMFDRAPYAEERRRLRQRMDARRGVVLPSARSGDGGAGDAPPSPVPEHATTTTATDRATTAAKLKVT